MKVYETCNAENKFLAEVGELSGVAKTAGVNMENTGKPVCSFTLDTACTFQTILGFGGAFTESAAYTLYQLPQESREEIIQAIFGADGLAYTMGRTHINSCDFSLENYTYVTDNDVTLKSFSIEREFKYVIPFLREAEKKTGKPLTLLASPWSPPAWMKTSGTMNHGGVLKEEYRELWAQYYCKYIQEMKKAGFDIWAVTVQNEPEALQVWDSCLYTAEEERDFVKGFLGPALAKNGLAQVKIIIHDHNRDRLFERSRVILDDPEANKYVWGAGIHWYCDGNYQNLDYFNTRYPDKKLIFTEGCQERGTHHNSRALGERYGEAVMNDLIRNTTAWIDWNLLLDISGGPNHAYNLCSAPIIADPRTGRVFYESSYYYLGHFSRFIKPGAKRVFCAVSEQELLGAGFKNPDGTVVVVMLNNTDFNREGIVTLDSVQYTLTLKAHSIQTLVF